MKKLLLFLDFDGVMVTKFSHRRVGSRHLSFDDECVRTLRETITTLKEKLNIAVHIVVTSNWKNELDSYEMEEVLPKGSSLEGLIASLSYTEEAGNRSEEICTYIRGLSEEWLILILDDEYLVKELQDFHIRTRAEDGIRDLDSVMKVAFDIIRRQLIN